MMTGDGGAGPHGGQNQDFDINLAPIIDCFTVLITFLLASASFLAIGIFDSSVAVPGANDSNAKAVPVRVDVELNTNFEMTFKLSGAPSAKKGDANGANYTRKLPPVRSGWNTEQLMKELETVQAKWPGAQSMVLSAADDVEYVHIVKLMETLRPKMPNVMLGGF